MSDVRVVRQTEYCVDLANDYGDFFVNAKWDGCCHIYRYYNGDTFETGDQKGDGDYIHICDLREFISFLTAIADIAENIQGFEGYESKK